MITTRKLPMTLALLLLGTGCDASEMASEIATEDTELRSIPAVPQIVTDHCPGKRQVARLQNNLTQCPNVNGWTRAKMFTGVDNAFGKFCTYDWAGAANTLPDVDALRAVAGVIEVESDCGAVFDHTTDEIWNVVGDEFEQAFHNGIGLASAEDLNLLETESSRAPVIVAVIDSIPEPRPSLPRSLHGSFMLSLVDDVACPAGRDESCAVTSRAYLGMPRYVENGETDLYGAVRGGHYGTQKDVAKAIYQAVADWQANASNAKLIINLSLGWERELFGDTDDSTPRPSVLAVHAAIEYARCFGALVIGAAGNLGYSCEEGPVAPAAWELHAMPSANRCALFNAPEPPSSGNLYAPLVYSVGGLTHDHQPMARSRVGGMPRLAALATNATTADAQRTGTGTSVAAAVTSGVAALVWSYNPQLTPAQVMDIIYTSGTDTSMVADYIYAGAHAIDVHAVDACAALEHACNLDGANCPADPFAEPLACLNHVEAATLTDLFDYLDENHDHDIQVTVSGEADDCAFECGNPTQSYDVDGSLGSCPEPTSMVEPYSAVPQPIQLGCPNCTLDVVNNVVYASIDPKFEFDPLLDVTLSVVDAETRRTTYFRLGDIDLFVGTIAAITLDGRMPMYVRSASISLSFQTAGTIIDPLLLGP